MQTSFTRVAKLLVLFLKLQKIIFSLSKEEIKTKVYFLFLKKIANYDENRNILEYFRNIN